MVKATKNQKGKSDWGVPWKAFTAAAVALLALSVAAFMLKKAPEEIGEEGEINLGPESFRRWPQAARVEALDPHVGLVFRSAKGIGFTLQALAALPANRPVLAVPYTSCITAASCPPSIGRAMETHFAKVRSALDDRNRAVCRVIASLLMEREKGSASLWHAWLKDIVGSTPPDNMLTWSPDVAACQSFSRNRTMQTVMAMFHGIQSALPHTTFADVIWGYSVALARGWDHAPPDHMIIVPIIDLTNVRTLPQKYLSRKSAALAINGIVRFDIKNERVVLHTTEKVPKGSYLVTPYASRLFPTDSVRMYGTLDPHSDAIPSHVDLVEHEGCRDKSQQYFNRTTGAPSANLLKCAELLTSGDKVKAFTFLSMHLERILKDMHGAERGAECAKVDKTNATLVVKLEMMLRAAYVQALVWAQGQIILNER